MLTCFAFPTLATRCLAVALLATATACSNSPSPGDTSLPDASDVAIALDTGDHDAATDTGAPDVYTPPVDVFDPPVVASSCDMLHAGTVDGFMVDEFSRQFILTLPPGAAAPGGHWPVVFNWHGLGDTAANMDQLLAGSVGNATMPFILVTPESMMLGPSTTPLGVEWDNIQVHIPSREAHLFDAVLHCLDQRWGVDADRVYTVGFSAGAIMSDLLGVMRGGQLAAVAAYSGAYFSNTPDRTSLGLLARLITWPAPGTTHFTQLLLSGGTRDSFSLGLALAHFDQFAASDAPYLRALGHDVISCDHGGGHTIPRGVMAAQLVEFFAAHPRGVATSPWAAALPADYPSYCTFEARGAM